MLLLQDQKVVFRHHPVNNKDKEKIDKLLKDIMFAFDLDI